jgi:hypothetical protein
VDEAKKPGVPLEQAGRKLRLLVAHLSQVGPDVGDHTRHPGHHGLGVGGALQVTILAVDDLRPDQLVGDVLGAAEAGLDEVAPAAAHRPQADPGPVAGEDRLPLAEDELLPAEALHFFGIVVVHRPTVRAAGHASCPACPTGGGAGCHGRMVS